MKKTFIVSFLLILILLLSSCASPSNDPLSINSVIKQEDFYIGGMGTAEVIYKETNDLVTKNINIDKIAAKELPVYINEYQNSQEGPEYELSAALKASMLAQLKKYITLLGVDADEQEYKNEPEYLYDTYIGSDYISAGATVLTANIVMDKPETDMTVEECKTLLEENNYLKAARTLMNIKNAYVEKKNTYNADGVASVTFTIFENSSDKSVFFSNRQFNKIEFYYSENLSYGAGLRVYFHDLKETDLKPGFVSYENAEKRFLAENKTMSPADIIACDITYNSIVAKGFFVPCYEFYFEQTTALNNNLKSAGTYYVAAYDVTELKSAE